VNNPFLLSLVCTNSCRFSGPLTLLTVFISQSFSPCRSFSHRSSTPLSVKKPPSVIAAWQALCRSDCRHSKSPHWSSFTMVSGAIIIIIIIIIIRSFYSSWTYCILVWDFFYCSLLNQILFTKLITVLFMSILKTLNHLYSNFLMDILKDPSLVLYSSSYTPLLSVLSYLILQQTTNSMHMILNFSSFLNICDRRRIRNTIDQTTACTIATSLIHSKIAWLTLFYSIYLLHKRIRLQLVLNSAARAVTKTPKCGDI